MHKSGARKYMSSALSLLLMILILIPCLAHSQTENEPNDRREQANEIRLGGSVKGYFQKRGDYDWFKLVIEKPGKNIIQIDLSGVPDVDVTVTIYDEAGRQLKSANASPKGEPEGITSFGVMEGTYYITAYGRDINDKDPYTLSTQLIGPWKEGQEFEPNDQQEQANDIRLGETVEGFFQEKRDYDWYKLVMYKPGKNIIRVDLSGVPDVDVRLDVADETGAQLKSSNFNRKGEPESIINLGVAEGIYYLTCFGYEANKEDKYSLSTRLIGPWKEGQEFEPNDSDRQANEIRLGETVQGLFQAKNDPDWYKLVIDKPGKNIIRVDLSGVDGVNSYLNIHDSQGSRIVRSDTRRQNEPEEIINFGVTEGVYYILIRANEINENEVYSLSPELVGPWVEGLEFESNDDRKKANEIKLDSVIEGHIQPRDDRDYYLITIPEPGLDLFVVELSSSPEANLHLELLDSEGKRIKNSNLGGKGVKEMIVKMKFSPGQYYIYAGSSEVIADTTYTLRAGKPTVSPASPEEVQKALEKALDFLASKQTGAGDFIGRYKKHAGTTGLSLMAFIGADCVPKDYTSNITKAVDFLKSQYHPSSNYEPGSQKQALEGGLIGRANPMYEHGIATLALAETLVETNDISLEPIIEDAIQLILRSQNTENKPKFLKGPITPDSKHYGGWRYYPDSVDSDLSVTGWPILALKAVLNAGFTVPGWSLQKALNFLGACHDERDGSFGYLAGGSGNSCVRAGIGALCLQLIGNENDPRIPPALRFMQNNPPVWNKEDPGNGYPFYYWYYGTRAMLSAGGEDWQIWKDWMCRLLVDNQNGDGSWSGNQSEENMPIYTTALGALMLELCCGHLPIYMRESVPRPGQVEVMFEKGAEKQAATNVEVILDASNSMWGQIQGVAKIAIAKDVLEQIINGLPDGMNVGLRLYGHRYGLNDRRACQDTELNVPIGPIDKAVLIDIIKKIQPKGKTPLVYSVLQAGDDFKNIQNGSIILITDGIESCDGDINAIAPALKESGIELKLHIVGFDIKEAEARAELEAIAKSTEGTYLDAKDSQELLSSLEQTLQIEFEILDEEGQVKAKGMVGGEPIRLMEGSYILRLLVEPAPYEAGITVKPGQKTTIILAKEKEKWIIKK
ncbi:MAG: VWA domain-containing protein [Candidatus Aminicenantes bacterium]|nr:VWA domain-containing protein [Candidatus Aminicenantes bacterium]